MKIRYRVFQKKMKSFWGDGILQSGGECGKERKGREEKGKGREAKEGKKTTGGGCKLGVSGKWKKDLFQDRDIRYRI